MQFEKAYYFLVNKLEMNLPGYLSYHNVEHTKMVIAAVQELAKPEGITGQNLLLLKTAALFHDAGFLINHQEHEQLSCRIAKEYLPGFGYPVKAIETICKMILTTKLPQSAFDKCSQILCDADLYYLGEPHYWKQATALYHEFIYLGMVQGEKEWNLKQVAFLEAHQYYTKSAETMLEANKQQYLKQIKQLLI